MNQEIEPDLNVIAEKVIGAAIEVHRFFGPGFSEASYHAAMRIELQEREIAFVSEAPVDLLYKGRSIGSGRIDLLVDSQLVVELKAAHSRPDKYTKQVLTYLKATGLRLGLILNFETELLKDGVARVIN
ncbi:MAG: GxxExxY protein [Planctomycetota bacterium]